MRSFCLVILFAVCIFILSACSPSATPTQISTEVPLLTLESPTLVPTAISIPTSTLESTAPIPFVLTSSAYLDGGDISDNYVYNIAGQCSGENISVPLSWSGAPADTQSFALIMSDPDGQNWGHWVQYNIPADVTSFPELKNGPDIGVKGNNDFNRLGYGGPCPPSGVHHYVITLYAVDTILDLQQGAYDYELEIALEGHILAQTKLIGLRSSE